MFDHSKLLDIYPWVIFDGQAKESQTSQQCEHIMPGWELGPPSC